MKFGFAHFVAGAVLAAASFSSGAQAVAIDKELTVNVYQLCSGASCASLGPSGNNYFAAETNDIWAQAGIKVTFAFQGSIDNSTFYNIDDSVNGRGFNDLYHTYIDSIDHSANLFLVNTVAGAYGEGYVGTGGAVIGMASVMAYNNGNGRLDTIAHELGHNLGLDQPAQGGNSGDHSPNSLDLMASGDIRLSPSSAANIAPSGLGYDQIPTVQATFARQSGLLTAYVAPPVPEPGEWAMMGLGLMVTGGLARRRKARVTA